MKKISVITTFYNSESTIKSAVDSILKQTCSNFEYILVDDGSNDGSDAVLNDIYDERITLLQPGRVGRAAALNIGLNYASGEYIAILDADDIALSDRLNLQSVLLDKKPNVVLVCSNAKLIDENSKSIGVTDFPVVHDSLVNNLIKLNPFPHSSVMYRRANAIKILGYNERCEKSIDYNFYLELLLDGGQFLGVKDSLICLRSYSNSWGKNDNQGLQIRYGIIGLINYYQSLNGNNSILRTNNSEWKKFKIIFDVWFEKHRFHKKVEAKKTFALARIALKQRHLVPFFTGILATVKQEPLFWSYRGCGFKYPVDINYFLKYLNKKLPELE